MKVKIKKDAKQAYLNSLGRFNPINWDFAKQMDQISGMLIEVDINYLFNNQINTVPVPGISENGFRLFDYVIEEVIDEVRHLYKRCGYCGKKSEKPTEFCIHCNKSEYLEDLTPWYMRKYPEREYNNHGKRLERGTYKN